MHEVAVLGVVLLGGGLTLALVSRVIVYFADHGVQPVTPARYEPDPAKKRDLDELLDRMNRRYIAVTRMVLRLSMGAAAIGIALLVIGLTAAGHL